MSIPFSIIVAVDKDFGIGKDGVLPWNLPGEIGHFKEVTTADQNGHPNVVIMGRKTWESIPSKFRPLSGRINIVLTRREFVSLPEDVLKASSLDDALEQIVSRTENRFGKVFVIGGARLFSIAINHPFCTEIYLTAIKSSFGCDCFFPSIPATFKERSRSTLIREKNIEYSFLYYKR
jgi:dihydrofolate reductase/thymidylate synthase